MDEALSYKFLKILKIRHPAKASLICGLFSWACFSAAVLLLFSHYNAWYLLALGVGSADAILAIVLGHLAREQTIQYGLFTWLCCFAAAVSFFKSVDLFIALLILSFIATIFGFYKGCRLKIQNDLSFQKLSLAGLILGYAYTMLFLLRTEQNEILKFA